MGKILNKYPFGSRVYGTHTEDSDYDYIVITDEYYSNDDINTHVYTVPDFRSALNNHDIAALEAYFLPSDITIKLTHNFTFILDKFKLRKSISTISSNSFVKGKKKLTVLGDYDKNLAIKSVFHSLRILDFGIQIANNGRIVNYSSSNWILSDLKLMTKDLEGQSAWDAIENKYKAVFNTRSSEFKMLCPKLNHNTLNHLLTETLKKHGVEKVGKLVDELEILFNTYDGHKGIDMLDEPPFTFGDLTFKCKCMKYEPGCFTASCRKCGMPKDGNKL